jgi:hypothetical protein
VRSVASRLARLERENRLRRAPRCLRLEYGNLKTLPDGYTGPRHTVTVRQLPADSEGHDWFDWEERPGPAPAANATDSGDELRIRVCYLDLASVRSH